MTNGESIALILHRIQNHVQQFIKEKIHSTFVLKYHYLLKMQADWWTWKWADQSIHMLFMSKHLSIYVGWWNSRKTHHRCHNHAWQTHQGFMILLPSTLPVQQSTEGQWKATNTKSRMVYQADCRLTTSFSIHLSSMRMLLYSCSQSPTISWAESLNHLQLQNCNCVV